MEERKGGSGTSYEQVSANTGDFSGTVFRGGGGPVGWSADVEALVKASTQSKLGQFSERISNIEGKCEAFATRDDLSKQLVKYSSAVLVALVGGFLLINELTASFLFSGKLNELAVSLKQIEHEIEIIKRKID